MLMITVYQFWNILPFPASSFAKNIETLVYRDDIIPVYLTLDYSYLFFVNFLLTVWFSVIKFWKKEKMFPCLIAWLANSSCVI